MVESDYCVQVCLAHLAQVLWGWALAGEVPDSWGAACLHGTEVGPGFLRELQDSGIAGGARCAVKVAHNLLV